LGALRRCKLLVQQSCTARFAPRIASQIRRPNVQLIHEQALSNRFDETNYKAKVQVIAM